MNDAAPASGYAEAYAAWRADPEAWWAGVAEGITWDRRWDRVFDPSSGPYGRWFPGATLNTCFNCIDRHVLAGRGEQAALIWDSPMTGRIETFTYRQMQTRTAKLAGALAALGVTRGDRVVIYLPMVPEAAIAMLACARLGAIHSVVFGGFAAAELASRIADAKPKVIVSASCGLEPGRVVKYKPLLDAAIALSPHKPDACLILQRDAERAELVAGRDHDLAEAEAAAAPHDPVPVAATDPLYILYTSGTTGRPKGVVRDNGGHAVALWNSMRMLYGVDAGDVYWAASDVGWVVGHSYIVYAPLLRGCTSVMYEGKPVGTPDAGAFWRVCAQHGVKVLFTAPTAMRAIKQQDPDGKLLRDARPVEAGGAVPRRRALRSADRGVGGGTAGQAGGRPLVADRDRLGDHRRLPPVRPVPVQARLRRAAEPGLSTCTRWTTRGTWWRRARPAICAPGCRCRPAARRRCGRTTRATTPPISSDFPGWYRTGDAGTIDEEGDVWVMGRTDDIINVAGHRLSTGQMEEVLASHAAVAECAVVGARDELKGQTPIGLVVLKAGVNRPEAEIAAELVALVRERIGPVAAFKDARVVPRLPKTRSGKILRGSIRRIADGETAPVPPTIEDPAALDEVARALGH